MAVTDIVGQRFCRLVVLGLAFMRGDKSYWLCQCDCGNQKTIDRSSLKRPNVSCGCLHREIQRARLTTHGMARKPEYVAWQAMLQRCENPSNPEYKNYGGRGIKVCKRWHSFENFFADMGFRPAKGYSLDRKENDGDYAPDNCRWATVKEQNDNKRQSRRLTFEGRTQSLTAWANEKGINPITLHGRIAAGWALVDALRP